MPRQYAQFEQDLNNPKNKESSNRKKTEFEPMTDNKIRQGKKKKKKKKKKKQNHQIFTEQKYLGMPGVALNVPKNLCPKSTTAESNDDLTTWRFPKGEGEMKMMRERKGREKKRGGGGGKK